MHVSLIWTLRAGTSVDVIGASWHLPMNSAMSSRLAWLTLCAQSSKILDSHLPNVNGLEVRYLLYCVKVRPICIITPTLPFIIIYVVCIDE